MTTSSVVLRDHGPFTLFLPTDQAFSDNLDDREVGLEVTVCMATSSVVLRDHGPFTLFLPADQAFSDNLDDREVGLEVTV